MEKVGRGIKLQFFGRNSRPNCTSLCQKMEKTMQIQGLIVPHYSKNGENNANSRSN